MKKIVDVGLLGTITLVLALLSNVSYADISRLTVDARVTPTLGVDSETPEFGWELSTNGYFDVKQVSYSIKVASSLALLESSPDCWASGEVASQQTFGVLYKGAALASSQRYFWCVESHWQGIDINNNVVEFRDVANGEFITGIMRDHKWDASWITAKRTDSDPMPFLYRDFCLDQDKENVQDAFLHICGLGQQIVSVNSIRVGNRSSVDPGWTNYKKSCLYTTFDVTNELALSNDCSISVLLGNGMFNVPGGRYVKFQGSFGMPQLIARLVIRYKDGSSQVVVSDENWKTLPSPVVFSCVYGGDDVDLSKGIVSKDRTLVQGTPANVIRTEGPGGVLRAQIQPPVVVWETMKPLTVKTLDDGKIEADFGFNFAGRPIIRCIPHENDQVTITLAEMEGKPWNGHSDSYTFGELPALKDGETRIEAAINESKELTSNSVDPAEKLGSVFGYWGFQYVYIDGADYEADLEKKSKNDFKRTQIIDIEADRIGADLEKVGSFNSDGAYLNEIDQMIDRSVRSNIVSLFTDCPHREKLGWLEETHLMGPSILYRYNLQTLFRKICRDMTEAQLENGMIPDIAPEYTRFVEGFFWSAEWSSACVQVPWLAYRWYGDESIIETQYDTMNKYVRYMASIRDENGLVKAGLGDWYDWTPEHSHAGYSQHTPGELTATAYLCDNARIMAIFAEKLNKNEDREYYLQLQKQAVADFQRAYFNSETNVVATGSQASYGFALSFDLIPEESREAVFENFLAEIERWEYRPSCGEVAWPFVIHALSDFGRADILWKMVQRDDAPGYVHMLTKWGMKTLSETWDGPGSSMNHFMFGAIQEWFSSDVVGIRQAEDSIAFQKSVLRPCPMEGKIEQAKGDYRTPYGKIVSDWKIERESGLFVWNVEIPTGTTSQLEIPVADKETVVKIERLEGEETTVLKPLTSFQVAKGDNPDRRVTNLGSGVYRVSIQLEK